MRRSLFCLFALAVLMSGCVTILSASQADLKVTKSREIQAVEVENGFLNLITPDFYITEKLAKECPGGTVAGVLTILEKREFIIVQTYTLSAKAQCQGGAEIKAQ